MRRLVAVSLVAILLAALSGCGAVHIRASFNSNDVVVSGFVGGILLTNVAAGNGTFIEVTVVTFHQPVNTVTFCGNMVSRFPMNSFVSVQFTPAITCSQVTVLVLG